MNKPGLYYPFIRVRDDEWLKCSALYWPEIRRIVPAGYRAVDSDTAQEFAQAGVLRDENPDVYEDRMTSELVDIVRLNADVLTSRFSLKRAGSDPGARLGPDTGRTLEDRALGWIHVTKFSPKLLEVMVELSLAERGRMVPPGVRGPGWQQKDPFGPHWIGLHPALAGAYMTALAETVSASRAYNAITDQVDLRRAVLNPTVADALRLLTSSEGGTTTLAKSVRPASAIPTDPTPFIIRALQVAVPVGLSGLSVDAIVRLRETCAEDLDAFRSFVAGQEATLAEISAVADDDRRLELVAAHVASTIERPLKRLEKSLRSNNVESVRKLVLASSYAPPALTAAAANALNAGPSVVTVSGILIAVGAAWWENRQQHREQRHASPVGYLMDVRDALTPDSAASRIHGLLSG